MLKQGKASAQVSAYIFCLYKGKITTLVDIKENEPEHKLTVSLHRGTAVGDLDLCDCDHTGLCRMHDPSRRSYKGKKVKALHDVDEEAYHIEFQDEGPDNIVRVGRDEATDRSIAKYLENGTLENLVPKERRSFLTRKLQRKATIV